MLDYLRETAQNWPPAGASLLLAFAAGGLLWFVQNRLTRFDDREVLFLHGNVAYLVQRLALVLAFGIAVVPTITRTDVDHRWYTLLGQALELAWVVVALLLVRSVVDAVVLVRIGNTEELLTGNTALGVVEAGFYVGFGFILNGSLTGGAATLGQGLASTVVFGALGLAVMVAVYWLHELVTRWHLRDHLREGRLTAAYEAAGVLASVGIVVREGVAGDFTGWTDGLVAFSATAVFSVGTLYLFRWLANRIFLRNLPLGVIQERGLAAASAFSATIMVVVAVCVAAVVRTQL